MLDPVAILADGRGEALVEGLALATELPLAVGDAYLVDPADVPGPSTPSSPAVFKSASSAELNQLVLDGAPGAGHQLCPAPSPMTTVQGRMVHEVTKPLRT